MGLTRTEWSGEDALLRWEPGGEVTIKPTFSSAHAGRYEVATNFDISFALPVSDEEAVQFALRLAPTDVVFVERQAYKQLQAPRFGDIAMVRDVYFSPTLGATRAPGQPPEISIGTGTLLIGSVVIRRIDAPEYRQLSVSAVLR